MPRSLLDHPLLASRYLFPRRAPLDDPFIVTAADGVTRLACYRASAHEGARTLLHFHGNGEVVADYLPDMASAFVSLGVNVVFAEYRGYGAATGSPSFGALLDDAEAIFAACHEAPEKIVLFGRSVGSISAIEVAGRHPGVAGLVLESSIADPLERLLLRMSPGELGVSQAELESAFLARMDHRSKLARYAGPMLVMHTAHDTLVPCSHGERNAAWGGGPPDDRQLVVFSRGNHNTILSANYQEYMGHVGRFLARLDRPRAPR